MTRSQTIPLPWPLRVRLLREDLQRDLEAVAALTAIVRRRGIIDELLADLDQQLSRTEAAAVITLVGSTGAGKSTLLNALAGREIAREGVDRPTTEEPTVYAPRDADLSALLADATQRVRVVRYDADADDARAHVYVDAPDMNSVATEHAARLTALAQRSDVLLVVLHRQSVVEAAPVAFLDPFVERRALAFVLNRVDELTDESRAALLTQIRSLATGRWSAAEAPIIAVSARRAREQPTGADRRSLDEMMQRLLGGQALDRIRRHNALGTAAMLARVFVDAHAESADDLGALRAEVGEAIGRLAQQVADESDERWRLRRADMNELMWAEAARRWEGPGGWALRAGGLDLAGMGAAGALARSHPLLAIGTAVSAAAASGVKRVVQERRFQEANPLMPSAQELESSYRTAMAPARIRIGRLCGDRDTLGLPSLEEATEAVADSVQAAWHALVGRELPRAAERSGLRFIRFLVDLPVYALVAWLVAHAALGFVDGNYVGVDFLLNAALLAGVYLILVRLVVRATLRRRARALLEAAAARSREGLGGWHDRVDAGLAERVAAVESALERLSNLDDDWVQRLSLGDASKRP